MSQIPRLFPVRVLAVTLLLTWGCQSRATTNTAVATKRAASEPAKAGGKEQTMQLIGPFDDGAIIDKKHTGEGLDRSPALKWSGAPAGTQSFLIVCDDPDAPSPRRPSGTPWVHWVIYNIPATVTSLSEGLPRDAEPRELPGAKQGRNSWDRDNVGYRGPLPPPGSGAHRYIFKIHALDTLLNVASADANQNSLLKAAQGHVLAEGQLVGKYER